MNQEVKALTRAIAAGSLVITPAAQNVLTDPLALVGRHASGDWGEVCLEDAQQNNAYLKDKGMLMSVYVVNGIRIWVITDPGWEVTTVLLPEDY